MRIRRHARPRGSVLLLALLLIAVVGLLTAGWLSVVTARSSFVEQMTAATQRRIALENSRALAQEFMLERVLPSTSGAAFSYNLPDPAWGGIAVPAWTGAPLLSVQKAAGINPFNPGNGDGYAFELTGADGHAIVLRDGDANPERKFQIKSRSPLLAGTLLVSQRPTLAASASVALGGIDAVGAAFLWTYPTSATITASSYATPDSVSGLSLTNSAGSTLLLNNLALPRLIANPRNGGAPFTNGQFDALDNSNLAANSSFTKAAVAPVNGTLLDTDDADGITCDGAGHVTVTLDKPALGNVLITGGVTTLTLAGQPAAGNAAADDLPAILILIDQTTGTLPAVTLDRHNSRRLVLAAKTTAAGGSLALGFSTTSAVWRLLLEIENAPVTLTTSGIVTLQGGLRSDRTVTTAGGTVRLTLEPDPKLLERLATRVAWVESFRTMKPLSVIRGSHAAAYTLIEVLVAAAILMVAVSAAAALALATVTQEETNARIARCLNLHEQAARLYQLGLEPATITAVLPADPAVVSLLFTPQTLPVTNLGTVERADTTLVFLTTPQSAAWSAGSWTSGESSDTARRTSTITAIRPSLR